MTDEEVKRYATEIDILAPDILDTYEKRVFALQSTSFFKEDEKQLIIDSLIAVYDEAQTKSKRISK